MKNRIIALSATATDSTTVLKNDGLITLSAPPQSHLTWAACDLAISVASGSNWFGLPCRSVPVLMVDLHMQKEVLAQRIAAICRAKGLPVPDGLSVVCGRGLTGPSSDYLATLLQSIQPGQFGLVIIDPFSRLVPEPHSSAGKQSVAELEADLREFTRQSGTAVALAVSETVEGCPMADYADTWIRLRSTPSDDRYVATIKPLERATAAALDLLWEFPLLQVVDARPKAILTAAADGQSGSRRSTINAGLEL